MYQSERDNGIVLLHEFSTTGGTNYANWDKPSLGSIKYPFYELYFYQAFSDTTGKRGVLLDYKKVPLQIMLENTTASETNGSFWNNLNLWNSDINALVWINPNLHRLERRGITCATSANTNKFIVRIYGSNN